MQKVLLSVLSILTLISAPTAAQQPPPDFDNYVKRVMETFAVPGLSVAIVKDGKVVLAK
jgi:CubicO group peptidase (beta-lactamase class C family)